MAEAVTFSANFWWEGLVKASATKNLFFSFLATGVTSSLTYRIRPSRKDSTANCNSRNCGSGVLATADFLGSRTGSSSGKMALIPAISPNNDSAQNISSEVSGWDSLSIDQFPACAKGRASEYHKSPKMPYWYHHSKDDTSPPELVVSKRR